MDLLEMLHEHEVITPYGNTPSVGVTGWATFGGYGLLSSKYGLGVDQIVGAKIVDAQRRRDRGGRREDSRPALVKRELEQMLDYKRRELRDLENGEGAAKTGQGLEHFQDEISMVKEQVDGLREHLRKREAALQGLRDQIEAEKVGAR